MAKPSVELDGVSKKFGLSLRHSLVYGLKDSLRRFLGMTRGDVLRPGEFWALSDVSMQLQPGDSLAILGVNGSGKTTLLRILNGTYRPDRGRVVLRGRIGALIAAGAGFSPMLTGRENVYISGALLGMPPAEIRRRFDEIVHFAGLEDAIDMPVRNYSSGMSVRLGFSVAVMGQPDILLVDEVLAVGDLNFQKKCFDRIHELRRHGTTILLVTHSPGSAWSVCNKGLFLHYGVSPGLQDLEEVCRQYFEQNYKDAAEEQRTKGGTLSADYSGLTGGTGEAFITSVEVCTLNNWQPTKDVEFRQGLGFRMRISVRSPISNAVFRYSIDAAHYRFIWNVDNAYCDGTGLVDLEPGEYVITTAVPQQTLRPGTYFVNAAVCTKERAGHIFFHVKAATFVINHPSDRFLMDAESTAVVYYDASYAMERIS